MVVVVMTGALAKCIRQFARIVKKNVKSLLNQEKIVQFIARTVFQSIKMAAVNLQKVLQVNLKPVRLVLAGFSIFFWTMASIALAQDGLNSNEIIARMKTTLDLQDDQIFNITPIIEKYTISFADLQKSIKDGTINQSAIDSQRQGLEASETQELSQYLKPNQLSQWRSLQGQMDATMGKEVSGRDDGTDSDNDQYSNLPGR